MDAADEHLRPERELLSAADVLTALVCQGVPGCDGASLSLIRDDEPSVVSASHEFVVAFDTAQYERGSGPCLTAMRDDVEVAVDDFEVERRWPGVTDDARATGVGSSLSLPLSRGDEVIGGLNLYAHGAAAFGSESKTVGAAFAQQAAMALGYLLRLQTERAAHARAREVSATLQRSLLPVLPRLPGVTTAARYLVGSGQAQVGGDWYDVFALPDGAIGIAIGDVMGHDIAAAAAMGQLRSVLRSYAYEGSSPSVVLDRLDRLVQDFEMAQLATAIYGRLVLDVGDAMLLFANAGHLPPLLKSPDGDVTALRRGAAPLIGVASPDHTMRSEGAVVLPAGSLLVLFTDGLVETRTQDMDRGLAKLSHVLAGLPAGIDPETACGAVVASLVGQEHEDDIALLVIRIDGRNP